MSAAERIDTDLEAFRVKARDWLEKNFPPSLNGRAGMMMGEDGPDASADFGKWKKAIGKKVGARQPIQGNMAAAVSASTRSACCSRR